MRFDGDHIISAVLAVIFCAVGVVLSVWGWDILEDASASADWPGVPGQVISSGIDHSTDSEGSDSYTPEVTYRYSVNSRQFEGKGIKFGETTYSDFETAQKVIDRYPPGRPVTVYFDPEDPQNAVLETGRTVGSYLVLAIGLCFVGVAVYTAVRLLFDMVIHRISA